MSHLYLLLVGGLLVTLGLTVFAAAGLLDGSGFLAVYVFGLVVGQGARRVMQPALTALNGFTWHQGPPAG